MYTELVQRGKSRNQWCRHGSEKTATRLPYPRRLYQRAHFSRTGLCTGAVFVSEGGIFFILLATKAAF